MKFFQLWRFWLGFDHRRKLIKVHTSLWLDINLGIIGSFASKRLLLQLELPNPDDPRPNDVSTPNSNENYIENGFFSLMHIYYLFFTIHIMILLFYINMWHIFVLFSPFAYFPFSFKCFPYNVLQLQCFFCLFGYHFGYN